MNVIYDNDKCGKRLDNSKFLAPTFKFGNKIIECGDKLERNKTLSEPKLMFEFDVKKFYTIFMILPQFFAAQNHVVRRAYSASHQCG